MNLATNAVMNTSDCGFAILTIVFRESFGYYYGIERLGCAAKRLIGRNK